MDFGMAAQLEKTVPSSVRSNNVNIVGEIFEAVRDAVRESVTKANWIDLELHKHLISKVNEI